MTKKLANIGTIMFAKHSKFCMLVSKNENINRFESYSYICLSIIYTLYFELYKV